VSLSQGDMCLSCPGSVDLGVLLPHLAGVIVEAVRHPGRRPLRKVLAHGRDDGVLAAGEPADAANAILGGLLLAVLGRAMTGADPTEPRFRQHLAYQLLRGVMTG
jgi:hypothetical protein